MLQAGYGQVDITPGGPVPLAGYFTLTDRLSKGVRDPLFVRALALREGGLTVVLLVYDLLMVTEEMVRLLRGLLREEDVKLIVHATHTHSSIGGYWDTFAARRALGRFRPGILPLLGEQGAKAARLALADLSSARWGSYTNHLPELAKNRRDPAGPTDDGFWALALTRGKKKSILAAGFPGHPVIVAERSHHLISADFPGEVVRRIEEHGAHGLFVNGALGGVDVLFPSDPISVDDNLARQAGPIAEAAFRALGKKGSPKGGLRFASVEHTLAEKPAVQLAFDDQPSLRRILLPANALISFAFGRASIDRWRVQGFALGDSLFLGAPADLGVSISLAAQKHAREMGFSSPFIASQCDGYLGYLHRLEDYRHAPDKATRGMAYYENAMGIFGRGMGERVLEASLQVVDELTDSGSRRSA